LDAVTKQVINDKLKNLSADDNKSQSMDESILMEKEELAGVGDKVGENGSSNGGDNQLGAIEKQQVDEQPQEHHRENGGGGGGVDKEVRGIYLSDVM
jgi:hypothetical protein